VVFAEASSHGATGKIQKMELRQRFAGHYATSANVGANI
jgi:fatty-acyl-CoA synthase